MKNRKVKMCNFVKTAIMLSFLLLIILSPETMLASNNAKAEFMSTFASFESLFTDLISTLGTIYTLWCVSEWGLAWHESNGTMGGQSFKRIFGGLVVVLSPQILAILA